MVSPIESASGILRLASPTQASEHRGISQAAAGSRSTVARRSSAMEGG